jgi:hypothetical protein
LDFLPVLIENVPNNNSHMTIAIIMQHNIRNVQLQRSSKSPPPPSCAWHCVCDIDELFYSDTVIC